MAILLIIHPVRAADIDITEFDDRIGAALGVGAFAGGLIISFVVWFIFTVFVAMITRRFPSAFYLTLQTVILMSVCIAFGWFPVWTLIVIVFVFALWFSTKVTGVFR